MLEQNSNVITGGSVAEWSDPGGCGFKSRSSHYSATFVNSQLVCLLPAGIFNLVVCNSNYLFIIIIMAMVMVIIIIIIIILKIYQTFQNVKNALSSPFNKQILFANMPELNTVFGD